MTHISAYRTLGTEFADELPEKLTSDRVLEVTCRTFKAGSKLFLVQKRHLSGSQFSIKQQVVWYQVSLTKEDGDTPAIKLPPIIDQRALPDSSVKIQQLPFEGEPIIKKDGPTEVQKGDENQITMPTNLDKTKPESKFQ